MQDFLSQYILFQLWIKKKYVTSKYTSAVQQSIYVCYMLSTKANTGPEGNGK